MKTRPALRPEEMVDALQDRIHPASWRLRAARPVVTSDPKTWRSWPEIAAEDLTLCQSEGDIPSELTRPITALLKAKAAK